MSKDRDDSGFSRLWSGGELAKSTGRRDSDRQPEPFQVNDKGMPLFGQHDRSYEAFDMRDNAHRLHIQCAAQPSRFPGYNYLLDIIYDHDYAGIFTLIYSFMTVEVTGHNLGAVVHAISFGNCHCIREFTKKRYDPPTKDKPIIESITITAAARMEPRSRNRQEETSE